MDVDGKYYCSRCMLELETEDICSYCGYDHNHEQSQNCDLEIGTVLADRYRLGSVLGRGGFGITYVAWDEVLEIPVAIKEYFPNYLAARDGRYFDDIQVADGYEKQYYAGLGHFLREARTLGHVRGIAGIVQIQDYFEENNTAYIVMEYIRGVSLKDYVKEHGISPQQLFEMLEEPIQALIVLHKHGVIHGDITPSNLIVQNDGPVKLIDFGSASKIERGNYIQTATQGYAAVEQYDKDYGDVGPWTDIYGLSASIYTLLTECDLPSSQERVRSDKLPSLNQREIHIRKYQEKTIIKGLRVEPEKRIRSMEQYHAGLYYQPLPETGKQKKFHQYLTRGLYALLIILFILYGWTRQTYRWNWLGYPVVGISFAEALYLGIRKRKTKQSVGLGLFTLFVSFMVVPYVELFRDLYLYPYYFGMTVLPLFSLKIAMYVQKQKVKYQFWKWNYEVVVYYFLSTVYCYILNLCSLKHYSFPIIYGVYQWMIIILVWFIPTKENHRKNRITELIWSIPFLLMILSYSQRFIYLITRLSSQPTVTVGYEKCMSWLEYRLAKICYIWTDLEKFGRLVENIWIYKRYVLIHGIPIAVLLMALECIMVYGLYRLYQRRVRKGLDTVWMKLMLYVIIFQTIIGIFMQITVTSSMGLIVSEDIIKIMTVLLYLVIVVLFPKRDKRFYLDDVWDNIKKRWNTIRKKYCNPC